MAAQGVRFARIHGRIVPIRQKQGGMSPAMKKTLQTGALAGAFAGAGAALQRGAAGARSHSGFALASSLALAGGVLGVAGVVRAVQQGRQAKKGAGLKTFGKHYLGLIGSQLGGQVAAIGGLAGAAYGLRGLRRAGGIAGVGSKLAKAFKRGGRVATSASGFLGG